MLIMLLINRPELHHQNTSSMVDHSPREPPEYYGIRKVRGGKIGIS